MIPRAIDSLDLVEVVMVFEEVFGVEIPNAGADNFLTPREVVDWREIQLYNQRPDKEAAAMLRKLARDQNNPQLAEGLNGTCLQACRWRLNERSGFSRWQAVSTGSSRPASNRS